MNTLPRWILSPWARPALVALLITSGAAATAQDGGDAARGDATSAQNPAARYRDEAVERWEDELRRLEQQEWTQPDPEDGILFIGSSSIRMWDSIAEDLAPYRPIQRGYGGAKFSDLAVFADRIIGPHDYRALVVFVANDVTGQPSDKSPEEIARLVRHILDISRTHQPDAPMFLVEITPTPSRFGAWPQIRQVNAALREIALTEPNTYFIATAEHFLDPRNEPRGELFLEDRLHLNRAGYDVWSRLIQRRLDDVLSS